LIADICRTGLVLIQIITEWKEEEIKRINISRSKDIKNTFVHRQPNYSGRFKKCTTNFITKPGDSYI